MFLVLLILMYKLKRYRNEIFSIMIKTTHHTYLPYHYCHVTQDFLYGGFMYPLHDALPISTNPSCLCLLVKKYIKNIYSLINFLKQSNYMEHVLGVVNINVQTQEV